jgi:transposase
MLSFFNTQIYLHPSPIDFRKQIDGLVLLVADHLKLKPTSGQLFLFRNKGRDKLKALYWERNGFWLLYRRLEQGRFQFPVIDKAVIELSRDELSWLLSGLNFMEYTPFKKVNASNFC